MPTYKTADRVFETSETTGAGDYDLDGAPIGFQSFAGALGANNLCPYFAEDGVNWEAGIGTVLTAPARLARTAILASSNAGVAVNWGVGTKNIRCGLPASLAAPRQLSKSVAGGVNVTLSQDEQRRDVLKFTGVLTANINVIVDETPWSWIVHNATSGNFTLTLKTAAGAGVAVPQGGRNRLYCDGVDVLPVIPNTQAKGDALVGGAAGVLQRKAVGANGYVRVADSAQADGWQDVPFTRRNLLINGAFSINQRAPASSADDTYAHDRWYALTQSNPISVSTLADVEAGLPFMARLTQSNAAAQRMGYAQIIEGKNCKHLRGKQVTFRFNRVRISASQAIRYAVLEWTGAEDAVVSDVVNDWASADYADGAAKFFVDASITPSGNTSHTPAANTLTDGPSLTVTLGGTFNNLVVLAWTEGTAAQNVTLDLGNAQIEAGSVATEFEHRPRQAEQDLCQRYFWKSFNQSVAPAHNTVSSPGVLRGTTPANGVGHAHYYEFPATMRATPTITLYGYNQASGIWSTGQTATSDTAGENGFTIHAGSSNATAGVAPTIHATAEAEL